MTLALWPIADAVSVDRLAALAAALAVAATAGADLLLAPEYRLTGAPDAVDLASLATASDGPLAHCVADLAARHGVALAAGYLQACSGQVHSAALVIDRDGHGLADYRRTHAAGSDDPRLAPGQWLTVVPLLGRRFGLLLGQDLLPPEPARVLALAGADTLLALGLPVLPAAALAALVATRALESGLCVAAAGHDAAGQPVTLVATPAGAVVVAEAADGLRLATLPGVAPGIGRMARRPRLYASLAGEEG